VKPSLIRKNSNTQWDDILSDNSEDKEENLFLQENPEENEYTENKYSMIEEQLKKVVGWLI